MSREKRTPLAKVGDSVIRVCRYNNRRTDNAMISAKIVTVTKTTAAGFLYVKGDMEKFHGMVWPMQQYRLRRFGSPQYLIALHEDTPENRATFADGFAKNDRARKLAPGTSAAVGSTSHAAD